jgi:hypothetical protein
MPRRGIQVVFALEAGSRQIELVKINERGEWVDRALRRPMLKNGAEDGSNRHRATSARSTSASTERRGYSKE